MIYVARVTSFKMAPIAWVEGKPVYRGDVLYRKLTHKTQKVVVEECFKSGDIEYLRFENGEGTEYADNRENCMTWQKPKTKREGWIEVCEVRHHKSKEDAERNRTIGCQIMYAQWEE